MVLGLTGKYCAGKNAVAEILEARGFTIVDVDRIGHRALEACRESVAAHFGASIVGNGGEIDRRRLGAIVFAHERAREELERIVHPWMVAEVERVIAGGAPSDPKRDFAINAALLFPMGLHRLCSAVVWVDAPLGQRIRRALRRDRLPIGQIARRLWAQRKLSPQPYRGVVDIMSVRNSGRRELLESRVLEIVARR